MSNFESSGVRYLVLGFEEKKISFESSGVRYLVLGLEEKNQATTIVVSYKELFPILRIFSE